VGAVERLHRHAAPVGQPMPSSPSAPTLRHHPILPGHQLGVDRAGVADERRVRTHRGATRSGIRPELTARQPPERRASAAQRQSERAHAAAVDGLAGGDLRSAVDLRAQRVLQRMVRSR
jgi:hypothetical protein